MKVATWLVATHFRPQLLRACLETLCASSWPTGWKAEIVVGYHEQDVDAGVLCRYFGARGVSTTQQTGAGKRNAALKQAAGDLVLVADDDDMHSADRMSRAVAVHENGAAIAGVREFRYLHLPSGNVVRWCGRGDLHLRDAERMARGEPFSRLPGSRAAVDVGTARSFKRPILERVGAWNAALDRLIEKDLQARIVRKLPGQHVEADLGLELANTTVCLQHEANVWDDRPCVPKGNVVVRGAYLLVGEGSWREAQGFPLAVADRLGLL